jgi:tetratricopeptide (TPR) repeat protein
MTLGLIESRVPDQQFSPLVRNVDAPPSSRPLDRSDHVESVVDASNKTALKGRGRSRSPVPRLSAHSRSKSAPRTVQRTSSLRTWSPSRIFNRSGTDGSQRDMSRAFAAETINDALPKQDIPKSSPLKTPASRMSSTGNDSLITGKGKMRRKMEPLSDVMPPSPPSAAAPATVGSVDGGPLFKVDLSKPTNRKQEAGNKRNTGNRKTKPSSRNVETNVQEMPGMMPPHLQPQAPLAARRVEVSSHQQAPGSIPPHFQPQAPAFDNSAPIAPESLPQEHRSSPMDMDTDTGLGEFCFSIGDIGTKSKRRPAKIGSRAHTKRSSEKHALNAAVHTAAKPATGNEPLGPRTAIEIEHIKTLEENARKLLICKDYKNAISWYSKAIASFSALGPDLFSGDALAALLFGRSNGYLSIRAAEAAILDCNVALKHVSALSQPSSLDINRGPILRASVHICMARALFMAGKTNEASSEFEKAVATGEQVMTLCSTCHTLGESAMIKARLSEIMTDGVLGIQEVARLNEAIVKLSSIKLPSLHHGRPCLDDRKRFVEALSWVKTALLLAPCCVYLHETKVALLVSLRRWHEVAGHCERLAVGALLIEGVSKPDIEARKMFLETPAVKELDALFFGDPKEEDFIIHNLKAAEKKLPSKATAEAFLRLPRTLMRAYLRSLRLEERYAPEEAAIKALQSLLDSKKDSNYDDTDFTWLSEEKSKLDRTRLCRDRGDQLLKEGSYDMAAAQDAACLKIDAESELVGLDGGGGRLHAVLHCNRAACFMALSRYEEAVNECSSALRIHMRYMKAIMRRARCFQRLYRWEEAAQDYTKYLDLVNEVKTTPQSSALLMTQCYFELPEKVSNEDILQVEDELRGARREVERKAKAAREDHDAREHRRRFLMIVVGIVIIGKHQAGFATGTLSVTKMEPSTTRSATTMGPNAAHGNHKAGRTFEEHPRRVEGFPR